MEKLKAAGLFRGELVSLSGSLARRYNECLAILGVKPTSLERFSIDGMGWSPEISEEKENIYYLNIGEANSNAIIITPLQEDKPVNMPFNSFDRNIMRSIFAANKKTIKDITKDSAICVQLDQQIDTYYEPYDLLRYDTLTISFRLVDDLDKRQKEQLDLIKLYYKDNNFIDPKLHKKIVDSSKKYGDLRNRHLTLEPLKLNIGSFYTRAYGGLFVLKDFVKDIIVFESKEVFQKAIKNTVHDVLIYHISHNELLDTLADHLITDFNIRTEAKTPRYKRIRNHTFVKYLKNIEHPITEILNNRFLFKKYLNMLDTETNKKVMSVEIYNQRHIVERELKVRDVVDLDYFKALHKPHSSLEKEQQELIWKLILLMVPIDPLYLYWYAKGQFYNDYKTWKPGYQDWVIGCILENNKLFDS